MNETQRLTPAALRRACRDGRWDKPTAGVADGFVQANMMVLPREAAFDFLLFCQRNPRPCPVIEVVEAGTVEPACAPGADLRTDLPRYRVYRDGEPAEERTEVTSLWRDDLVAFLIGCSFSFEEALAAAGVPLRHVEAHSNVPMYRTSVPTSPAGRFHGPLVVSMRPIPAALVPLAVRITSRFARVHGAPVHVGAPEALGIRDLSRPEWGDPVEIRPGELPVFWACGVTPQAVALASGLPFCITHAPGHMLVTDLANAALADS
jgi:uncharacterized protein YcsI (UPF0317 family)